MKTNTIPCFCLTSLDVCQAWPLALYDSMLVYAHAMHTLLEERGQDCLDPTPLKCWELPARPWTQGQEVYAALAQVNHEILKLQC